MAASKQERGCRRGCSGALRWKPRQIEGFICFFLRWEGFARIVLAVRGSYALQRAVASAVSIL